MSDYILLCTVGGSHQPVLKSIESAAPRHVCFFCTDRDSETGKQGSIVQVTGKDKVIKANAADAAPTLPNIPSQAGLDAGQFEARTVPADDLDGAFFVISDAMADLAERFPQGRLVADYTGGTKTMTAALVCAALERDDVELQLVAGARANLDRVKDGTEHAMLAGVAALRLHRAMTPFLAAWQSFAYREAAVGLARIRIVQNDPGASRLRLARSLSRAFAHWDDFDHGGALELLDTYASRVAPLFPKMLPTLRRLTNENKTEHEPARLFDLWLNADRRAAQGRFDDAVARWYRLVEWTAQWQIRLHFKVETKEFPLQLLPAGVQPPNGPQGEDGTVKVPLLKAWEILAASERDGACTEFFRNHEKALRHHLEKRNNSILAHGFRPVLRDDWLQVDTWTKERFMPLLGQLAAQAGLRETPTQLPRELPEQ